MANPTWSASGDYFETCTCDYLCPCLSSNLTAPPTKGDCVFAFAFRVDHGRFGDVSLDGLCFALAGVHRVRWATATGRSGSSSTARRRRSGKSDRRDCERRSRRAFGGARTVDHIVPGRGKEVDPLREGRAAALGLDPRRPRSGSRRHPEPDRSGRAARHRQQRSPGEQARRAGTRHEERDVRVRPKHERHEWTEQRSLRTVRLAGCGRRMT